jgi:MFS family permease
MQLQLAPIDWFSDWLAGRLSVRQWLYAALFGLTMCVLYCLLSAAAVGAVWQPTLSLSWGGWFVAMIALTAYALHRINLAQQPARWWLAAVIMLAAGALLALGEALLGHWYFGGDFLYSWAAIHRRAPFGLLGLVLVIGPPCCRAVWGRVVSVDVPVDAPLLSPELQDDIEFVVSTHRGLRWIRASHLRHLTAAGNYVELNVPGENLLLRDTLGALEQRLEPLGFVRIHRSHLVLRRAIVRIERCRSGTWQAHLDQGETLPIGRAHRAALTTSKTEPTC